MNAKTDHGARVLQLNKMLEEASKKITRIEAVFPGSFMDVDGFFQLKPIDYADVIISFSVAPPCNTAKEFIGKEFVIGLNTFRIFAAENLCCDVRVDGFTWRLKTRCTMRALRDKL